MAYESAGFDTQDTRGNQRAEELRRSRLLKLQEANSIIQLLETIPHKQLSQEQKVALTDAYSSRTNLSRELGVAEPAENNRWAA